MPHQHCLFHADWARRLGSLLYAHLLTQASADYDLGGPLREFLDLHASDPGQPALPLRMMGSVHRLVLEGCVPALARYYPSAGGSVDLDAAWQEFRETIATQREAVEAHLMDPVQTNDAARSASLLGGFLLIAAQTGLPLRLLELGCSAGLNLCWDRYRYSWRGGEWGDPNSALLIEDVFVEGAPPLPASISVASRQGCDPCPVDARTAEGRLTLRSYTWPDHVDRMRRLETAIGIARTVEYRVERAGAAEWLKRQLADSIPGVATVIYHSVVWPYLGDEERSAMIATIETAGAGASPSAPLAWLRMEPGAKEADLTLRIYPDFAERVIATCGFHTPAVRWLG